MPRTILVALRLPDGCPVPTSLQALSDVAEACRSSVALSLPGVVVADYALVAVGEERSLQSAIDAVSSEE